MPLEVQTAEDRAVVKLSNESFSDTNIQAVGEQLFRLADKQGHQQLHLDLAEVQSFSGTGLGKLVALHRKVRRAGGRLTLVNVPAPVYEVIQVTRLDQLLDVRRKEAG
jgi:anti-anti-sigma factor